MSDRSFLNRKNMSPEVFFIAEFDRDIQNFAKVLGGENGGPDTKNEIHAPGVHSRAFYAHFRLVSFVWTQSVGGATNMPMLFQNNET